jgi:hypothetical protein
VQVIKVDMERRQVDLGLVDILEAVRASEDNRGPRRSSAEPKRARAGRENEGRKWGAAALKKARPEGGRTRKGRPGRRERSLRKGR